jgi:adenylate kinase
VLDELQAGVMLDLRAAPGLCDECGTELITRRDDTEEVIWQRLKVYRENTAPLIEYYRLRGLLHSIDGTPPVAQISIAVRALIRRVSGVDEPTLRDRQVAP